MYPYLRSVADELRTLRLVYRLSTEALDAHRLNLPATCRGWEAWDHADQFILESINEQLNRVVDAAVISAFVRLRNGLTIKETRLSRAAILRQFEEPFHIDAASLPGWQAVLSVARDANATKHRAGVHWTESGEGIGVFAGTVQLYRSTLNGRIRNVGRWLRAFGIANQVP